MAHVARGRHRFRSMLACLIGGLAFGTHCVLADEPARRWAVLVGVNDYAYLKDLEYCTADMQALRDQLVASGFPPDQVALLNDAATDAKYLPTKSNIERQLALVLGLATRNDLVVVAFAGHGVHLGDKTYLCPNDAEIDRQTETLVAQDDIYARLAASKASFKLLVVDACRNDPRLPGARADLAESDTKELAESWSHPPRGIQVLSSCAPGQLSFEDDEYKHGVFTYFLLEGLAGQADSNRNGKVSLFELYEYAELKTKVRALNRHADFQTPMLNGETQGVVELADLSVNHLVSSPSLGSPPILTPRAGEVITNSIGMKFALIPAGEFMMGNEESVEEIVAAFPGTERSLFEDGDPAHKVRISQPYYLGVHEVTLGQFLKFYNEAKYKLECERNGKGGQGFTGNGSEQKKVYVPWSWGFDGQTMEHPVVNVSYNDAVAFCEWLSVKERVRYRLPTEAEWEYACRAGATTRFHNSDDAFDLVDVANVKDRSFKAFFAYSQDLHYQSFDDGHAFTAPVGSFQPNAFGLYDMHGNVWEWCSDWYNAYYYTNSTVDDPHGPASGENRVVRGGCWGCQAYDCRSAHRQAPAPDTVGDNLGFRVARDQSSR